LNPENREAREAGTVEPEETRRIVRVDQTNAPQVAPGVHGSPLRHPKDTEGPPGAPEGTEGTF